MTKSNEPKKSSLRNAPSVDSRASAQLSAADSDTSAEFNEVPTSLNARTEAWVRQSHIRSPATETTRSPAAETTRSSAVEIIRSPAEETTRSPATPASESRVTAATAEALATAESVDLASRNALRNVDSAVGNRSTDWCIPLYESGPTAASIASAAANAAENRRTNARRSGGVTRRTADAARAPKSTDKAPKQKPPQESAATSSTAACIASRVDSAVSNRSTDWFIPLYGTGPTAAFRASAAANAAENRRRKAEERSGAATRRTASAARVLEPRRKPPLQESAATMASRSANAAENRLATARTSGEVITANAARATESTAKDPKSTAKTPKPAKQAPFRLAAESLKPIENIKPCAAKPYAVPVLRLKSVPEREPPSVTTPTPASSSAHAPSTKPSSGTTTLTGPPASSSGPSSGSAPTAASSSGAAASSTAKAPESTAKAPEPAKQTPTTDLAPSRQSFAAKSLKPTENALPSAAKPYAVPVLRLKSVPATRPPSVPTPTPASSSAHAASTKPSSGTTRLTGPPASSSGPSSGSAPTAASSSGAALSPGPLSGSAAALKLSSGPSPPPGPPSGPAAALKLSSGPSQPPEPPSGPAAALKLSSGPSPPPGPPSGPAAALKLSSGPKAANTTRIALRSAWPSLASAAATSKPTAISASKPPVTPRSFFSRLAGGFGLSYKPPPAFPDLAAEQRLDAFQGQWLAARAAKHDVKREARKAAACVSSKEAVEESNARFFADRAQREAFEHADYNQRQAEIDAVINADYDKKKAVKKNEVGGKLIQSLDMAAENWSDHSLTVLSGSRSWWQDEPISEELRREAILQQRLMWKAANDHKAKKKASRKERRTLISRGAEMLKNRFMNAVALSVAPSSSALPTQLKQDHQLHCNAVLLPLEKEHKKEATCSQNNTSTIDPQHPAAPTPIPAALTPAAPTPTLSTATSATFNSFISPEAEIPVASTSMQLPEQEFKNTPEASSPVASTTVQISSSNPWDILEEYKADFFQTKTPWLSIDLLSGEGKSKRSSAAEKRRTDQLQKTRNVEEQSEEREREAAEPQHKDPVTPSKGMAELVLDSPSSSSRKRRDPVNTSRRTLPARTARNGKVLRPLPIPLPSLWETDNELSNSGVVKHPGGFLLTTGEDVSPALMEIGAPLTLSWQGLARLGCRREGILEDIITQCLLCDMERYNRDAAHPAALLFPGFWNRSLFEATSEEQRREHWSNVRENILLRRNTFDRVVAPINVAGSHWILAIFDFAKRRVVIYDPIEGNTVHPVVAEGIRAICEHLGQFLNMTGAYTIVEAGNEQRSLQSPLTLIVGYLQFSMQ